LVEGPTKRPKNGKWIRNFVQRKSDDLASAVDCISIAVISTEGSEILDLAIPPYDSTKLY